MNKSEAIELALKVHRRRQRSLRRVEPPEGMLDLIKIAASAEVEAIRGNQPEGGLAVKEAAVFYLRLVLTQAKDDHGLLGLRPGASLQSIKDHKRLLLKWLHPDRNCNAWESALLRRVTAAADRLETSLRNGVETGIAPTRHKSRRRNGPPGWRIAHKRIRLFADLCSHARKIMFAALMLMALLVAIQAILWERNELVLESLATILDGS